MQLCVYFYIYMYVYIYIYVYLRGMVLHVDTLTRNASRHTLQGMNAGLKAEDVDTERAKYQQVADGFLDAKLISLVCRIFHF